MLFILLALALFLALCLSYLPPKRPNARRCKCGRPADICDHDRPWVVYCGKCYLEKEYSRD